MGIPIELQDVDYDNDQPYIPLEPDAERMEADDYTPEECDNLIAAEVLLPKGDILVPATVVGRKRDHSGQPVGTSNPNPILDTRVYNVQFSNGHRGICCQCNS